MLRLSRGSVGSKIRQNPVNKAAFGRTISVLTHNSFPNLLVFASLQLLLQNDMKRKKTPKRARPQKGLTLRTHRLVCLLNDAEQRIVDRHLKKYKISNKSGWMRETLLKAIQKRMVDDYPMLFEEHEMRR